MVFNLASAGLVYTAYNNNATNVLINNTEFGLSITEIVLIVIEWVLLLQVAASVHIFVSLPLLTVQAFNIAYSAYVIEYYNSQIPLPLRIINIALAIIVLNCLLLCGCCIGRHVIAESEKNDGTAY
jgi:hypothetical protein